MVRSVLQAPSLFRGLNLSALIHFFAFFMQFFCIHIPSFFFVNLPHLLSYAFSVFMNKYQKHSSLYFIRTPHPTRLFHNTSHNSVGTIVVLHISQGFYFFFNFFFKSHYLRYPTSFAPFVHCLNYHVPRTPLKTHKKKAFKSHYLRYPTSFAPFVHCLNYHVPRTPLRTHLLPRKTPINTIYSQTCM